MLQERQQLQHNVLCQHRVAVIGCGVMGEAIISALIAGGRMLPSQIRGGDVETGRRAEIGERYGIEVFSDNRAAVKHADLTMIAVKPYVLDTLLAELSGAFQPGQIVISIVAGARLDKLECGLRHREIVRAMPNTPARIGCGTTAWYASTAIDSGGQLLVEALLGSLGDAVRVDSESAIDIATALSGSGPAYVFQIIEAMTDAGVQLGLSRTTAERLVLGTLGGATRYAQLSGQHPAVLRAAVTTPGGTTASGLDALERGGLRVALTDAVIAAHRRAIELGQR
ncbi:MAG TPA: pyrroline-5-carboxylate reductase [Thermomicrobiaceae bacterium]|nr:pyrroline-5-carboxylate reductase [Thermomicrobiaceae bacterium]